MKRIIVVGGGVSGLAAAHRLAELARERSLELDVRLLEASDRTGGTVSTARRDGFVLEHGPDSMITDKPWGVALARRLGLHDELIGTQETHRRSFVVRGGKLMPVPEGFQLLAPSRFGPLASTSIFSPAGKARMAMDLVLPKRTDDADESLGAFVLRRLGREALERMAQPMIAGIYGADPMELSLRATLPRFLDMEREHGSVIRGMWARMKEAQARSAEAGGGDGKSGGVSGARYGLFVSFRGGMQTFTDALRRRLPEDALWTHARVGGISRSAEGWSIRLASGEQLDADGLILALPAYRCAELLRHMNLPLGAMLEAIPYAAAATLTLCYRREEIRHPLDGFGFVVPAVERFTLLGCTFSHVKWADRAPEGMALLRVFLGERALRDYGQSELERRVRDDLRRLLGVKAEPQFREFWHGERCMPQYRVGHLERIAEIERHVAAFPGLALAGNAFRGVGVPDCVHSGEQAAERLLGDDPTPA